jgi:N-acetylglucosamine-6-phosphate deacetylase
VASLRAARVLTPSGVLEPGVVEVADGRIVAVEPTTGTVPDRTLGPGFVDLQVNGIDDVDVASAEGDDWERLDERLVAQGVTTWCPTLVTAPLDAYAERLGRIAAAAGRPGARPAIAGAHLEGPFLGERPGAHRRELIAPPDLGFLDRLPEGVAIMTLGAEVEGAAEAIGLLARRGVLVSLGHSAATYEQARAGIDAGARLVTHGFNAMSGLDHRRPGLVGAALTDDRIAVSLIADLIHVHPAALRVAFRCKPVGRVVLVTDAVAVAWRPGVIHDGDAPRLADGTLAGSTLVLDRAVANVVGRCGVGLAEAVAAAATTPANLLGLTDRGRLEAGTRADLAALGPDLRCVATWIGGEQVWG